MYHAMCIDPGIDMFFKPYKEMPVSQLPILKLA